MHFTVGGEMCGYNSSIALLEGNTHREARKFAHRSLNSTSVKQWQGMLEAEAHKTLRKLLETPNEFVKHFHLNSGSSIMRIAYGYEIDGDDDQLLRQGNMVITDFSEACAPGRWIVVLLPFLKHVPDWMPGAGFKKIARKWRADLDQCYKVPFDLVKRRMVSS